MNPNTQFSFMHHLGVPSVRMQSLWLLGFMILEWRVGDGQTDTQTLTFIIIDFIYYIFYRGWPDIKSFIENKLRILKVHQPSRKEMIVTSFQGKVKLELKLCLHS